MIIPLPLGGVKAMLTEVLSVTVTIPRVGGSEIVYIEDDIFDTLNTMGLLGIICLIADTVNVYSVFGVNPDTVIGDDVPIPIKPSGLLATV